MEEIVTITTEIIEMETTLTPMGKENSRTNVASTVGMNRVISNQTLSTKKSIVTTLVTGLPR